MKKLPFHPILFAAYPILSLYAHNLGLFPWTDILRPLGVSVGIALALWGLLSLILKKSVERAAAVVSVLLFLFYTFSYIYNPLFRFLRDNVLYTGEIGIVAYVLLALALVVLVIWKSSPNLTKFLNVVSAILVAFTAVSMVTGLLRIRSDLGQAAIAVGNARGAVATEAPDIFYIILDGYGREDELQKYFGFSNQPFIQSLQQRGFYVVPKSRSNYCQTELSLSSSLNMNFVSALTGKMDPNSMDRAPLDYLLDESEVAEYLKKKGYEYIGITSGFPGVNPRTADVVLTSSQGMSLFESSLLTPTPLAYTAKADESMYDARREQLNAALLHLQTLGPRGPRPRFIFAHVLAPHPPFVYGPNGEHIRPEHTVYGFWDASAFFAVGGTQAEYHEGYKNQLIYLNKRLLPIIDQILKDASVRPVIILQGDHGSRAHLSQDTLAASDVREAFRNFCAMLVPPQVRAKIYDTITPVNIFRAVLDGLFGEQFPMLPDRSYYTTWDHPYQTIDITDRVEKKL